MTLEVRLLDFKLNSDPENVQMFFLDFIDSKGNTLRSQKLHPYFEKREPLELQKDEVINLKLVYIEKSDLKHLETIDEKSFGGYEQGTWLFYNMIKDR